MKEILADFLPGPSQTNIKHPRRERPGAWGEKGGKGARRPVTKGMALPPGTLDWMLPQPALPALATGENMPDIKGRALPLVA